MRFFILPSTPHDEFISIFDRSTNIVVLQTRQLIHGSHRYIQVKCNELNKRFNG